MKRFLILGACCAAAWPASHTARAQTAPAAALPVEQSSGYEQLARAGKLLYPEPGRDNWKNLPEGEQFRLKRLSVARNALALSTARQALPLGIVAPTQVALGRERDFGLLVEQFLIEADVRADDGDVAGAAQSALDAYDLGAQIGGDPFEFGPFGFDFTSEPRARMAVYATQLDAAQCRALAAQLERIAARRASFAAMLEADGQKWARRVEAAIADPTKFASISVQTKTESANSTSYTLQMLEPDKRGKTRVTLEEFRANNALLYFQAGERAQQPYQTVKNALSIGADAYSQVKAREFNGLPLRYAYEREVVADRLLIGALRLRARRLESGQYPANFEAGVDPFSPTLASLVYRLVGEGYQLYSVGPNGDDDGGNPLFPLRVTTRGAFQSDIVNQANGIGDIIAPVL